MYRKYALDDAKERFPDFDTDRDGVVSWEEYNIVSNGQLINFDGPTVPDDPEKESLRYVRIGMHNHHYRSGSFPVYMLMETHVPFSSS